MLVVGGSLGVVAGLALARLSRSFLYGLDGPDWGLIAAATAASTLVSLVAAILPANRAAHVKPVDALRVD